MASQIQRPLQLIRSAGPVRALRPDPPDSRGAVSRLGMAASGRIPLKKSDFAEVDTPLGGAEGAASLSDRDRLERQGEQLGELTEVLGGGGEEEFILCAVWTSEAQPIELQDAFEVGEQHLDLLPLAP